MPLKAIRTKVKPKDVALAVTSIAAVVADVADMASFPPVRAAATVILVILQTIQEIEFNKDSCHRLARRAARLLLDVKHRMDGRWESAPKALVDNILEFNKILEAVRDFMQELTKIKWMGRLLQKSSIEESLNRYYDMLEEAEKAFQISSLVEIHYAVGLLQQRETTQHPDRKLLKSSADDNTSEAEPPPVYEAAIEELRPAPSTASTDDKNDSVLSKCMELIQIGEVSQDQIIQAYSAQVIPPVDNSISAEEAQELENEIAELDKFGFKRLHQSDVRLKSSMKGTGSSSFWSGCSIADVDGQRSIIKRYESSDEEGGKDGAKKKWLHDVKQLKELFHANLPQMLAFSDDKVATPFIVLADVKLRDPNAYLLNFLKNRSIVDCVAQMLRMYRDVSSAVMYAQRQLRLDENETQNFVSEASYSLDGDGKVIVGLPPPKNANSVTIYAYGLTDSLLKNTLKYLPTEAHFASLKGTSDCDEAAELRNKYAHFRGIILNLLPKGGDSPALIEALEEFLDEDEEDQCRSLTRLRELKLDAGGHDHSWHEGVHACSVQFDVGDLGYISSSNVDLLDKDRFNHFVKIGNVLERNRNALAAGNGDVGEARVPFASQIPVVRESTGTQTQWLNGIFNRQDAYPFILPGEMEGWPLSLPTQEEISILVRHTARMESVNEAWRFLIREAKSIAKSANVEPQDIVLITSSVRGQTYTVKHFGHVHHLSMPGMPVGMGMNHPHAHNRFGFGQQPQFGRPGLPGFDQHHNPAFRPPPPQMLYLFTSSRPGFQAFWSANPSAAAMPVDRRDPIPRDITERTGWPEAYINYIQLSKEDFDRT